MLTLRIASGPLAGVQKRRVLSEYERLTQSAVEPSNFENWLEGSPLGPAQHAVLENEGGELVGHCCLFPLPMAYRGTVLTAAKAEYYFIHEGYRRDSIRGFEGSTKPVAVILLEQLYRQGESLGWGPLIASAPPAVAALHRVAGCRSVVFPLHECLFVLRPLLASRATPNLAPWQRASLLLLGSLQSAAWQVVGAFVRGESALLAPIPCGDAPSEPATSRLQLPSDPSFLAWRYPAKEYECLDFAPGGLVVVKNASAGGYLRVCHYQIPTTPEVIRTLLLRLIRRAEEVRAVGVRWAAYQTNPGVDALLTTMRTLGFMTAFRERRLLLYSREPAFLATAAWEMQDSFVSFDA